MDYPRESFATAQNGDRAVDVIRRAIARAEDAGDFSAMGELAMRLFEIEKQYR